LFSWGQQGTELHQGFEPAPPQTRWSVPLGTLSATATCLQLRPSALSAATASTSTSRLALSKSVRLTQRLARHRSLVATMVYTHPSEDDLMRALRHVLWIENMPLEL
jgi:hypothetical protein